MEKNKPRPAIAPFIVDSEGPPGLHCVFEDDGETGYLYVYEPDGRGVLRDLHIYDRSPQLSVSESDVEVIWSVDKKKCGVMIRGQMRGIIDLGRDREGRVWMDSDDTPGISDADWLDGF